MRLASLNSCRDSVASLHRYYIRATLLSVCDCSKRDKRGHKLAAIYPILRVSRLRRSCFCRPEMCRVTCRHGENNFPKRAFNATFPIYVLQSKVQPLLLLLDRTYKACVRRSSYKSVKAQTTRNSRLCASVAVFIWL